MSMKKTEQIGANQYCVTFDASRETFDAAITKAYKKAVKNIMIPGFRKGKAPRAIVEKMYGKEVFYEDAINDCLPEAFEAAEKEFDKVSGKKGGQVVRAKTNDADFDEMIKAHVNKLKTIKK